MFFPSEARVEHMPGAFSTIYTWKNCVMVSVTFWNSILKVSKKGKYCVFIFVFYLILNFLIFFRKRCTHWCVKANGNVNVICKRNPFIQWSEHISAWMLSVKKHEFSLQFAICLKRIRHHRFLSSCYFALLLKARPIQRHARKFSSGSTVCGCALPNIILELSIPMKVGWLVKDRRIIPERLDQSFDLLLRNFYTFYTRGSVDDVIRALDLTWCDWISKTKGKLLTNEQLTKGNYLCHPQTNKKSLPDADINKRMTFTFTHECVHARSFSLPRYFLTDCVRVCINAPMCALLKAKKKKVCLGSFMSKKIIIGWVCRQPHFFGVWGGGGW